MYDKRDAIDFDVVNFSCLDGDIPRRFAFGVYISTYSLFQTPLYVFDFNSRNKILTATLINCIINSAKYFRNFTVDTLN